jgi:hypothetical protein
VDVKVVGLGLSEFSVLRASLDHRATVSHDYIDLFYHRIKSEEVPFSTGCWRKITSRGCVCESEYSTGVLVYITGASLIVVLILHQLIYENSYDYELRVYL